MSLQVVRFYVASGSSFSSPMSTAILSGIRLASLSNASNKHNLTYCSYGIHLPAAKDWDIQQIDVKAAFLYGLLPPNEAQYLEQPLSFEEPGKEDWVWCLQCGLYGMKQSSHIWNKTMHKAMSNWGFK